MYIPWSIHHYLLVLEKFSFLKKNVCVLFPIFHYILLKGTNISREHICEKISLPNNLYTYSYVTVAAIIVPHISLGSLTLVHCSWLPKASFTSLYLASSPQLHDWGRPHCPQSWPEVLASKQPAGASLNKWLLGVGIQILQLPHPSGGSTLRVLHYLPESPLGLSSSCSQW